MEIEMCAKTVNSKLMSSPGKGRRADGRAAKSATIARFFETRLRLNQLRMLVAIADLGQLKRVADALHVTPPAISKQLAELEHALGEPILQRVGNRLEFTPVGGAVLRRAREVLAQIELARVEVEELCSGLGGTLGIGAVQTVAPLFFPAIVSAVKSRAPAVSLRLQEGRFVDLAPMLRDGALDLVFARDTTQASTDGFESRAVMTDPLAVVCGSQHPLAAAGHVAWKDLNGVPWILPMRGSSTFMHLESLLLRHRLSIPRNSIESGSWSGSAGLLQTHLFVALFPLTYARKFLYSQHLSVLPLSTEGIQDTVRALWRVGDDNSVLPVVVDAVQQLAQAL